MSRFALALLIAAAGTVGATEPAADPLTGKFELGYLATSGNTETSSLNSKLGMVYDAQQWRHSLDAAVVQAEDSGVTTAERHQLGAKSDYKFNESDYLFITVNWEQDRFAGFEQRTSEAVGYGRRILKSERHSLDAELGAGARQTTPVLGPDVSESILRAAAKYKWSIAEGATFDQSLVVESGESNTYLESVSALAAKLIGSWSMKFSYTIKHNSDVAVGLENTDTYTAVGIEYGF
jgi:putative salt-induced outer membrane protein